jgi:hypothetical protein
MQPEMIGFAAVVLSLGIPLAAIYAFYRIRKLKTDERLAAIARGVSLPQESELPHYARSRRVGILLVSCGLGWFATMALIARVEPDALTAAAMGIIPVAIGIGFFIDATLLRRELHPAG